MGPTHIEQTTNEPLIKGMSKNFLQPSKMGICTITLAALAVIYLFRVSGSSTQPQTQHPLSKDAHHPELNHQKHDLRGSMHIMIDDRMSACCLSAKERDVALLMIKGSTNKEIASRLQLAESTIKYHVRNILRKTGSKTRAKLLDTFFDKPKPTEGYERNPSQGNPICSEDIALEFGYDALRAS